MKEIFNTLLKLLYAHDHVISREQQQQKILIKYIPFLFGRQLNRY